MGSGRMERPAAANAPAGGAPQQQPAPAVPVDSGFDDDIPF